jgi:hypothetical protein
MMVYVSNPYSGAECLNTMCARHMVASLAAIFPHIYFYNPIDAMKAQGKAELSYESIMAQCKEVIKRSDAVILGTDWETSTGCRKEKEWAEEFGKPIYVSAYEFIDGGVY